jgi:hypothetical protein
MGKYTNKESWYDYLRKYIPGWYYPPSPEPLPKTWRENIRDIFNIIFVLFIWTNGFGYFSHFGPRTKEVFENVFAAYVLYIFLSFVLGLIFRKKVNNHKFLKHIILSPDSLCQEGSSKVSRVVGVILYCILFIGSGAFIGWFVFTHYFR